MGYEAVNLYQQMPENMKNMISDICVLNACSHSGLIDQAQTIFNGINEKTEKVISTMVCFLTTDQCFLGQVDYVLMI